MLHTHIKAINIKFTDIIINNATDEMIISPHSWQNNICNHLKECSVVAASSAKP